MLLTLTLAALLLQDGDAALLKRLQPIVDRACDLDPAVRAEAATEAARLFGEQGEALARSRNVSAMIVTALAGKQDPPALFRRSDRSARRVACDLTTAAKEQVPDLLRILEGKDIGLRIAACRALGRVEDPALRQTISSALGHGMRRAGAADVHFAVVCAAWRGTGNPHVFHFGDGDPERMAIGIAALCNTPGVVLTEAFAPSLSRLLENDKIDRSSRSLLIRAMGRNSPSAFCPLLALRDRTLRSEIVDVLDRTLVDPLVAPALYDAWREAKAKKTDDGRAPAQP